MRYFLTAGAAFTVALAFQQNAQEINGNWYANEVKKMKITGLGGSGEYNSVTDMDFNSETCSSKPVQYSGPLGPLGKGVCSLSHLVSSPTMLIISIGLA